VFQADSEGSPRSNAICPSRCDLRYAKSESFLSTAAETRTKRRSWSWIPLGVALVVVALDQITKALAVARLSSHPEHLFGPLGLQLTYNTGSAFSLFTGSSVALMVVDVVLVGVLIVLGGRATSRTVQIGIGLMLGGAVGNFLDRIVRHHDRGVVDFITLSHWPTFNLADSAITVGAIVVVIGLLGQNREQDKANGSA